VENIEDTVEELDEIMENLDLGNSSGHLDKGFDENYDNNCNNPSFWKIEINGIYQNTKFWSQQKLLS
jgi:hypothetical protein